MNVSVIKNPAAVVACPPLALASLVLAVVNIIVALIPLSDLGNGQPEGNLNPEVFPL